MSIYIKKFQYVNGKYVQQRVPYRRTYCKNCKHFSKNGEICRLFVVIDIVNGNENIVKASEARNNVSMCGFGASYYEPIDKSENKKDDMVI